MPRKIVARLADLPEPEARALKAYAACHGPDWRRKLASDWMRAGTACPRCKDTYHELHRIRNRFAPLPGGPGAWLNALPDTEVA